MRNSIPDKNRNPILYKILQTTVEIVKDKRDTILEKPLHKKKAGYKDRRSVAHATNAAI